MAAEAQRTSLSCARATPLEEKTLLDYLDEAFSILP